MTTLHHREDGPVDAPVLVLGPSLGTDLHLFDDQIAPGPYSLARTHRVIRYDLPGHGRSPAAFGSVTVASLAGQVIDLLDGLGVHTFHYGGVSLGGAIGQQLAVDEPERVTTLAVLASAARFADPPSWAQRAATVRERGTGVMLDSRPGTWFTHAFAEKEPDEAQRLLTMLQDTTDEGYAACCEAIATFDIRGKLARVRAPTLAIAGADDPATPPPMVQLIAYTIPDARFRVVAGTAHLLNAERPDEVNRLLAGHLALPSYEP